MTRNLPAFLFLNLGHAADHLFMLIFPTAVIALQAEWHRPYGELLALGTLGFVAFGAGSLPAGWLGDRWSRTGMMTVFFVGIGLASALTGLARTPFELAAGLTLIGLFASIYHPVGIALVVEDAVRTGRALGVNGVFGNLGVAAAPLLTGAIAAALGWRAAFIVPGLLSVAAGIAYALVMRRRTPAAAAAPRLRAATAAAAPPPVDNGALLRVFAVIGVTALCAGLVFNVVTVALPKLFEERLDGLVAGLAAVGGVASAVFAVAALAQIVTGHLLDRYGAKWLLVGLTAAQVPLLLLAGAAHGPPLLFVAVPLLLCVFGQIPITDWLVGRHASAAWRSRVLALKYVLVLGVSALAVPLVATLHATGGGFAVLFVLLAGAIGVVTVAALALPGGAPAPAPARAATT
ncbi:MAG TPA: MFS transporter [Geminicoccaceae bacterium]|nr:MFS transporter [Geminicoccaceae bacterium]